MLIIQFMGFSIKVLFAMFKGLLRPLLQSETYRAVHRIYKLRGEIYKGVKSYYTPHFFCQSPQQYSIRTVTSKNMNLAVYKAIVFHVSRIGTLLAHDVPTRHARLSQKHT